MEKIKIITTKNYIYLSGTEKDLEEYKDFLNKIGHYDEKLELWVFENDDNGGGCSNGGELKSIIKTHKRQIKLHAKIKQLEIEAVQAETEAVQAEKKFKKLKSTIKTYKKYINQEQMEEMEKDMVENWGPNWRDLAR